MTSFWLFFLVNCNYNETGKDRTGISYRCFNLGVTVSSYRWESNFDFLSPFMVSMVFTIYQNSLATYYNYVDQLKNATQIMIYHSYGILPSFCLRAVIMKEFEGVWVRRWVILYDLQVKHHTSNLSSFKTTHNNNSKHWG